jgi:hypothetical protein
MAEYIVVDANGKELRREPKGRGRNRIGAVKLPDGNFQVTDVPVVTETPNTESVVPVTPVTDTPKSDDAPAEPESEPAPSGVTNYNPSNLKTFKVEKPIPINSLPPAIFTSPNDRKENANEMEFLRANVVKQLQIPLPFNAVFARILADKKTGDITIWSTYPGSPKYMIEKALDVQEVVTA